MIAAFPRLRTVPRSTARTTCLGPAKGPSRERLFVLPSRLRRVRARKTSAPANLDDDGPARIRSSRIWHAAVTGVPGDPGDIESAAMSPFTSGRVKTRAFRRMDSRRRGGPPRSVEPELSCIESEKDQPCPAWRRPPTGLALSELASRLYSFSFLWKQHPPMKTAGTWRQPGGCGRQQLIFPAQVDRMLGDDRTDAPGPKISREPMPAFSPIWRRRGRSRPACLSPISNY